METVKKQVKLRPKQVEQITQISQQRQQLNAMLQEINTRESSLLELILEEQGITSPVSNVKLVDGFLEFEVKSIVPKKVKSTKTRKLQPEVTA